MNIAVGIALYIFVGVLVIRLLVKFTRPKYFYNDSVVMGASTLMWPGVLIAYGVHYVLVSLGKLAGSYDKT
jgi:hypothetical protein